MASSYEPVTPPPRRPRSISPDAVEVPSRELEQVLRRELRGEVRFSEGDRALWATDASNYRQIPIGVVLPRDAEDIVAAVEICRRFDAPVLPRGGGTSLAGQCCNVAVVVDTTKYMGHILDVDPDRRTARVQPGVVLDSLRRRAAEHGLTFGPDPATHSHCTLGGMIGNNSCGVHSLMAGCTADNVLELDVLTYDGLRLRAGATPDGELERLVRAGGRRAEIYGRLRLLRDRYAPLIRGRYPDLPRRVSGYNLDELLPEKEFHVARALVGSEGTCAFVLAATLRLVPDPAARKLVVLGYPSVYEAGSHIPEILRFGPVGLEGIDDSLTRFMRKKGLHPGALALLPEGAGWLLVELGGDSAREVRAKAESMIDTLQRTRRPPAIRQYASKAEEAAVWEIRESGLGATAFVPGEPDAWPGWEDSAVAPARIGDYLRDLRGLLDKHGYRCALYGHFGQGCVHTRIDFDLTSAGGIARYRNFVEEAADLVMRYGGSFSGEHGDGQARAELLPKMYGPELVAAFREFKHIWDPQGRMNPGKVADPDRLDENLRLGAGFAPARPATHFRFPEDEGSFGRAALRCVGVGKCRRDEGGTMCPSYMVTREELHTTRGRAHALFEMLQGGVLDQGWRDEHVKEALDLCLSCKGCKSDCPVNVDVATYKAEFLSHYYRGKLRPRAAYSMGLIMVWARLAALAPGFVNRLIRAPGLGRLLKAAGGIAPERELPPFAPRTFRSWFFAREAPLVRGPDVLLWPDTFNNHFRPETAIAATEILEDAGWRVRVPRRPLCCGRPLYDYGMLTLAKRFLRRILDDLRPLLAVGVPVVGLEPSCISVFRDELRFIPSLTCPSRSCLSPR